MIVGKRAFISYRRESYDRALLIRRGLRARGIGAFLDVSSLHAGGFDKQLRGAITSRSHFIVVLTPDALTPRPEGEVDWLRRELEIAVLTDRTLVPIFDEDFQHADLRRFLPPEMAAAVADAQGLTWTKDDLHLARMNKLARMIRGHRWWPMFTGVAAILVVALLLASVLDVWPFAPPGGDDDTDPTATTEESAPRTGLAADEPLDPGQQLVSEDGRHTLTMQDDGRLVGRTDGDPTPWFWVPANEGTLVEGSFAYMGGDSNFVIYAIRDEEHNPTDPRWSLGTQDEPDGGRVEVRDIDGEGYLVLITDAGETPFRRPYQPAVAGGAPDQATTPSAPSSSTTSTTSTTTTLAPAPTAAG